MIVGCMLAACEKPYFPEDGSDDGSEDDPSVEQPSGDDNELGAYLLATNDTARFYLSPIEIKDVMLIDHPTPSNLIKDSRYRLPWKLEVADVLKNVDLPTDYWQSRQRILCHDTERGGYYTYTPHSNITQAGYKTAYCILPIRSERLPQQDGHLDIDVNDEWK